MAQTYDRLDSNGLLYLLKGFIAKIKTNIKVGDLKDGADYATKAYADGAGKIDSIKVNGVAQAVTDKAVDITVPTDNKSLANGAGYQTAAQVSSAVSEAVGKVTSFEYEIVTELPATGVKGKIYLIADTHSDDKDSYDEYMWIGEAFEKIGNTDVDLTNYVQSSELTTISNEDIDTILAQAFAA